MGKIAISHRVRGIPGLEPADDLVNLSLVESWWSLNIDACCFGLAEAPRERVVLVWRGRAKGSCG